MDPFVQNYLLPWLHLLVVAFIPVASTIALAWARKRGINTDVLAAAGRAAGVGYEKLRASGVSLSSPQATRIVTEAGVDYLMQVMPDKVRATGQSLEGLQEIVKGEWGRLLATDPNVALPGQPR